MTTASKNNTEKSAEKTVKAAPADTAEEKKAAETGKGSSAPAEPAAKKKITAKEIDPSQYVTVRNGFRGRLVYVSPKTGERFIWDKFGDEQEIELRELKGAKTSAKRFFVENWFLLDDWVIEYLGVGGFYRKALKIEEFDEIFNEDPDTIAGRVSGLSSSQKDMLAYLAKEKIRSGEIDSLRTVAAFEKALGTDLIEK